MYLSLPKDIYLMVWLHKMKTNDYDLLWKLTSTQPNNWYEGRFSYSYDGTHRIIFEGKYDFI